jgi:hypothetical protein
MVRCRTSNSPRPAEGGRDGAAASRKLLGTRPECLEQILRAFRDIADRDDIHQAAERLTLVQDWIRTEAERAAADPIFVDLRLV